MNIVESLGELSAKRKAIQDQAREQAKAILAPGLQQFMKEHPELKALSWTQYTPYFNDGDPCVFRFNGLHASAEDSRDDSLYGDGWHEIYGDPEDGFSAETWTALKALEKTLSGAKDELEAAFGDHVQVIVTPEGVDVDDYEHD